MNDVKIGIQLYTLRNYTAKDFFGTLEAVADMGYDSVEFSGFNDIPADEMARKLSSLGLSAPSAHLGINNALPETIDSTIAYLKTIGAKYYVFPSLPPEFRYGHHDFEANLEFLKKTSKKLSENGISMLYHNHSFEFEKVNDLIPLDVLFESLPAPLLYPQFDTCWVKFAGYDPVSYINKYSGRTPCIHLKDYFAKAAGDRDSLELRPLGLGINDIKGIIQAGIDSGCRLFVYEQDNGVGRTMYDAAKLSREYIKSLGY